MTTMVNVLRGVEIEYEYFGSMQNILLHNINFPI